MFAIEIKFPDSDESRECILVRRPVALIGIGEHAHIVIDGAEKAGHDYQLSRLLGRKFRCRAVPRSGVSKGALPPEKIFDGTGKLMMGDVEIAIFALDLDLIARETIAPDREGLRVLRQSAQLPPAMFPAMVVVGRTTFVCSFPQGLPVKAGRNRTSHIRLESGDVSGEHAVITFDGHAFSVEDLGSTNGTWIEDQRMAPGARTVVPALKQIRIGSEFTLIPVRTHDELKTAMNRRSAAPSITLPQCSYPCVVATETVVQPQLLGFEKKTELTVGREPENDMWIPLPHISRKHLTFRRLAGGVVEVTDSSSNGTLLDKEQLPLGLPIEITAGLSQFDLGAGVELALCSSASDHEKFLKQKQGIATEKPKAVSGTGHDRAFRAVERPATELVKYAVAPAGSAEGGESDGERPENNQGRHASIVVGASAIPTSLGVPDVQYQKAKAAAFGVAHHAHRTGYSRIRKFILTVLLGLVLLLGFFVAASIWK